MKVSGVTHTLKVLLIDDNPADRLLTSRILRREFPGIEITSSADLSSFRRALEQGRFDIVLTDYRLAGGTGLDVVREVKSRSPERPVIMFAATGAQKLAVEAMTAGLDDYVIKSAAHLVRLPMAIRSLLERIESKRRAERAERRVSHLLQHFNVGLFRMTPAGHLIEANQALFALLELPSGDPASVSALRARLGPWPPGTLAELESDAICRRQLTYRRRDGRQVWLTVSERIDRASAEPVIEGLVEDISNAQRALREAEAANRAKDAFLANLSHELRTPLNAMVGWVRLLRMGSLDVRQAERALETIERNAHAQARLIDELLDLSRIVTGNLKLELRPVDLSAAVRAMMDAMGPHARDKRVQLRAEVDPTIGPVLGDAVRLQQALGNLLSNAIKFTPAGGTVGVRLARAGPSHAEIAVTDTGKGIASHLLPHIFDGFRQGDMTCAPAHRGLGLTIARQLVELHGGAMRAHSAGEGCGTTVTVTLPVPPNLPERATRQPSPARYELLQPETLQLQGLYVLIVEDDPDVCELLTVALERWGARVAVATGAREAFTLFVTTHPDIVVSDIAMPEEDGYSLIRRLRAAESGGRRVPAIAVTAFASEDHRAEALAAGFDVHLPKPVQLPDLGRLVAELGAGRAPAR